MIRVVYMAENDCVWPSHSHFSHRMYGLDLIPTSLCICVWCRTNCGKSGERGRYEQHFWYTRGQIPVVFFVQNVENLVDENLPDTIHQSRGFFGVRYH